MIIVHISAIQLFVKDFTFLCFVILSSELCLQERGQCRGRSAWLGSEVSEFSAIPAFWVLLLHTKSCQDEKGSGSSLCAAVWSSLSAAPKCWAALGAEAYSRGVLCPER